MIDLSSNEPIRTLGLYQPYAGLMLHGKIETRWVKKDRKPPFPPGIYLIYSTQKAYTRHEFRTIAGQSGFDKAKIHMDFDHKLRLNQYGLMLAVLPEGGVYDMTPNDSEAAFVEYCEEQFYRLVCLKFEQQTPIKPFKFEKGKQGIGFLSAEDRNKIQLI